MKLATKARSSTQCCMSRQLSDSELNTSTQWTTIPTSNVHGRWACLFSCHIKYMLNFIFFLTCTDYRGLFFFLKKKRFTRAAKTENLCLPQKGKRAVFWY